jgi:PAS domain S-box-containing protein
MNAPLRVLHLEDDIKDTELVQATLEAEGISGELARVEAEEDFVAALKQASFDLILADFSLPSFDGLSALKIAQQHAPDVPFIFVSGKLGEEAAIEALKMGATDYVLKTRLARLGPAVTRALAEAREKAERTRAEQQLSREQQRFRDMVNSVEGIVWEADAETFVFSFVSKQAERILGYPAEQWLQEPKFWKNHLHPEDRDWAVQFCMTATAEKRGHDFEYRMIAADGRTVWFRDVVTVVVEDDRPTRVRGVMLDTTERKRAEEAVRRSEQQLRDLVETMPAMAFVTRPGGSNEFVSRQWIEFSGLSPEQSAGAGWAATLHPEDVEQHLAKWRASQASGEPFENEARHRDAHGNYRWLLVRAVPLRDDRGNILKWYGTAIDVEDRKRAEEELRRSEAYLAEAERLSQTGSWAWSYESETATYWSDENFRIWGLDPQQGFPDQKTLLGRIHPDDLNSVLEATQKARREKSDQVTYFRIVLPDGTVKHLESAGRPVFGANGELIELVGTHLDVTDRKRAEALLTGEKRLLEMIATGVPLNEIMTALCVVVEEQRPGTLASVLMLSPDGVHLNVVAGPNLPNDWTRQMETLPIGPCAGSCGTAAYRGSPVIVSDIATDPLWDVPEHRASALNYGLRASWSNPVLSSQGKVLGTFCMYYREARSPTSRDLELMELATHLVRVAIERDRAEEALRASEQLARSHVEVMMRSLDVLATEAAPEKFIAEMLRTIGQRLHASSVLLWLRDYQDDSLRLQVVIDNDQQVAARPDHPFVKNPDAWKGSPYFQEMFFTKGPVVCDDIEHDPRIGVDFREYLIKRGRRKFMAVPMFVLGEVRGFIGIQHVEGGTYRPEEVELAQALAHHVMMAAHGAELAEQRRHAVVLEERTRMARDIHDTLAQGFTGVIVQLDTAVEALRDEEPEAAAEHIRQARELARESLTEARRSVHALRPQALERAAFAAALKAIITNAAAGTSLRTDFQLKGEPRELQSAVEENLLRIGQEALTNALKHAGATKFQARLYFDSDAVRLELRDNGKGFVVDFTNGGGIGLIGMKERAQQIGATLVVTSKPGGGTRIVAVSPYQQPAMT